MFKRVLLVLCGISLLSLTGCGGGEQTNKKADAPAAQSKPAEEKGPVYEVTKDEITSHPGWTSRNISVLGLKLGDKTREVEKNLGDVENTRTLPDEYLTLYQGGGLLVYTHKLTGKARKIDINQAFAKKVADAKIQKLLTSGDLKIMREVLGMEEGEAIQNTDDNSTEYPYDSRGFRFIKIKVPGGTVNALRFLEMRKTT
jgi:hypothetical protein